MQKLFDLNSKHEETFNKRRVKVILNDETVWLSQKSIDQLFGVQVPAISKHLRNIFETGELEKDSTVSILETVQKEGSREVKKTEYINLNAIIFVGYRANYKNFVNSGNKRKRM